MSGAASVVTGSVPAGGENAMLSATASAGNMGLPANPALTAFESLLQSAAVIPAPSNGIEIKNTLAGGALNLISPPPLSGPLSGMTVTGAAELNPALPQQQNLPGARNLAAPATPDKTAQLPASSAAAAVTEVITQAASQLIAAQSVSEPGAGNADAEKPLAVNEGADSRIVPVNPMAMGTNDPAATAIMALSSGTEKNLPQTAPGVAQEDNQETHSAPARPLASGQRENIAAPLPQNTHPLGAGPAENAKAATQPSVNPPILAQAGSDFTGQSEDASSAASDHAPSPGRSPGNVPAAVPSADNSSPAVPVQTAIVISSAQEQTALNRPIKPVENRSTKPVEKAQTAPSELLPENQKRPDPLSDLEALTSGAGKDAGPLQAQAPSTPMFVTGQQSPISDMTQIAVTAAGAAQTAGAAPVAGTTALAPEIASASERIMRPAAAAQDTAQPLKDTSVAPAAPAAAASPSPGQAATQAQTPSADGQILAQNFSQTAEPVAVASQQDIQISQTETGRADGFGAGPLEKSEALRNGISPTPVRAENHPPSPPIRDIAIHISQHADTGANRFQLRLDPPELGRVEVRMEISPEGKLSAVIAVERPETLDLLQRDQRALERSLTEAGLKTDSNSLNFSLKGGRHDNQSTDLYHKGADSSGKDPLSDDWDEPIAPIAARFSNRAVNIHI